MDELKAKIEALGAKIQKPPNWFWAVLGGLIFIVMLAYIRWLLAQKTMELAMAKTALATAKHQADEAVLAAKVEKEDTKRLAAEAAAKLALAKVADDERSLAAAETAHNLNLERLKAVQDKDWVKLNQLAGVR